MLHVDIDEELLRIIQEIPKSERSPSEWARTESCDEFQTVHYCDGFDSDENAFCFSFYDVKQGELWFQFTLDQVTEVLNGARTAFEARRVSA